MKKLLLITMAFGLYSCQPEEFEPVDNIDNLPVTPVACTLKLSRDFNPLAGYQFSSFQYTDINGIERYENNPPQLTIDSVDFNMPVRITAYAGNNLDPQVLCNWNLKKDGVVIEIQNVTYFLYEN